MALRDSVGVKSHYRYRAYKYDKETGLYYLNARMYDPKTARFMQEDTYRGNPKDPLSYSGLRISEALNLTLSDVDLGKELISVKNTKNKIDRTIPINSKLKSVLKGYLENGREDRKTENFFSTYPLGQISLQCVNKKLRNVVKNVGIEKKISAHNFRHSFASNLIIRGVDVVTLKKLLGHRHLKTTSIYCHTNFEELQEAVNVL